VPELVSIREARMRASPFAFLRGAPAVMAADLATTPVTGIPVQACGDAHLLNFGLFATPERNLVFGLNDFDETLPGPWEWDVKRLATSFVVAARTVGFDRAEGRRAALAAVRTYREQLARYAGMRLLEVWYSRVDAATIVAMARGRRRRVVEDRLARAQHHTNDALPRLTEAVDGGRRFLDNPPLLTHVSECGAGWVEEVLARYRSSLEDNRASCWRGTGRWTPPARWSGWAASAPAATWCCCSGTATTTRCCSRSSRPPPRCWSRTPAAAATATTAGGWSTASGCCRRPATSSSAGPATASPSTTSASSGT
jgi:Uncharacterized protein conserved in bacteria (DUF2252)